MNKTLLFFGFLLGLLVAGLGCGKEDKPTISIKGTVIDQKTGQPINDAFVYCRGVSLNEDGGEVPASCSDRTDVNGQFACVFIGNYGASTISKEGYIDKFVSLNVEDKEDDIIQLIPRDGFMRLRIENNTGQHDTLYASVYSRIVATETMQNIYYDGEVIKEYPLLINQGEIYTEIFDLPSTEVIQIRWGFEKPTYQLRPIFQDSIPIIANDTVTYILSY